MKTIAAITSKAFCLKTGHDGLILRTATACVTVREPDAVMTRRFPPPWSVEEQPRPASSHEKRQLRCDHVKEDSKQDRADHFHFRTPSSSWRSPPAIFASARLPSPQDARVRSAQSHSEHYCPPRLLDQGEPR